MGSERPKPWLNDIRGSDAHALIESDDPLIRVNAGPGTGKTTCLQRRARRLIEGDGVDPKTVFVGTFTRAIANELKCELGEAITVSTLHSHAYRLLRRHPEARQGMELRFLLSFEEDAMLYDIIHELDIFPTLSDARKELRRLQASRARRTDYTHARFSGAITRWLQRHRAMLIGDVVHLCVTALESEDIPKGRFDHVVVDEYQDLTACEQEFVRLLWSGSGCLTVLGDNNQSIYGFRFNHPDGIEDFAQQWAPMPTTDLTFLENHRCDADILHLANLMMAEGGSTNEPLRATRDEHGELVGVHWPTPDEEVKGLAKFIRSRPDEEFTVLVPRRFIGYRLREEIGEDARTEFHEEALEHHIAQEAFVAASMLADRDDRVAVRTWLGFHAARVEHAPQRNAAAYRGVQASSTGHDLIALIADPSTKIQGHGQKNLRARARAALELMKLDLAPAKTINMVFDPSKADAELDTEKHQKLVSDLTELRESAHEILAAQNEPNLKEVIDKLRYRIATRASLRDADDNSVRVKIMTLHGAKGLEAENVVIAGVVDQVIPGLAREPDAIEEQRRLLYVSITRAKSSLIISWPRRVSFGDASQNGFRTNGRKITASGTRWIKTTRSSLLPQGMTGIEPGETWLAGLTQQ